MTRSPRLSRGHLAALPATFALVGYLVWEFSGELLHVGAIALGPLAGGFVRDGQSCCVRFSLWVLPVSAALVALGLAVQFLVEPRTTGRRCLRGTAWVLGLLGWFGGAIVSYLHALE